MLPAGFDIGDDKELVGRSLAFAGKAVSSRFEETLTRAGGSLPAWLVLFTIANRGPVSQRELAECIHLESATVTYHLDRLDAAGLITRRRDDADRRVWRAELTEAGTDAFTRMKESARDFETALRAGLSDHEVTHFLELLARVSANAEAFDASAEIAPPPSRRTPERKA